MTTQALALEAIASCSDVEVVYGEGESAVRALGGVSLEIRPHESVVLLGRSGSGKTTLLHILGGLVEPTAGSVEWHGRPLSSLDRAARGALRARRIAYVFQGANLLPFFTAIENVSFAAHLADAIVQCVCDVHVALAVDGDTVGVVELRRRRLATVT